MASWNAAVCVLGHTMALSCVLYCSLVLKLLSNTKRLIQAMSKKNVSMHAIHDERLPSLKKMMYIYKKCAQLGSGSIC